MISRCGNDSLHGPSGPSLCDYSKFTMYLQSKGLRVWSMSFPRQSPCNGDVKSLPSQGLTYSTFSSVDFSFFYMLVSSPQEGGSVMIT